ncbi:MAG: hypothetical protein JW807_06515 [Spirochaetes bacterium]|nr:hypothetical protein [Spirochaetota bacterium]
MINHIIASDRLTPFHYVVLFAIYAFLGWIIEVIYRSATQRRFINAGFLHGPCIPVYGFGAAFILILNQWIHVWPVPAQVLMYGLVLTMVEYIAGFLFEKIFKLKLWDYAGNRFNLHGRICLLFSVFWTGMAFIFLTFIHPAAARYVLTVKGTAVRMAATMFMAYITADFVFSVTSMTAFRNKIAYLYSEYLNLSTVEIDRIFASFRRLRNAFPNLNGYIDRSINEDIKKRIGKFMESIQQKVFSRLSGRQPFESEFNDIIRDIYTHEEFMKLKQFHHHNSSIYEHAREVAYLAYRIAKFLKLDYRSAARGALLHDFFLYDWRNHDEPDLARDRYHGIEHPKIALANAEKNFVLNDIERDSIVKHMWPLTLMPPRYKESYVVTFADKYVSSREFVDEIKKQRDQMKKRRPRLKRRVDVKPAE